MQIAARETPHSKASSLDDQSSWRAEGASGNIDRLGSSVKSRLRQLLLGSVDV
jgi:hypothetical protein